MLSGSHDPTWESIPFYKKVHKGDRTYQFWQEGVHPETRWHIRFIQLNGRHRHPKDVSRMLTIDAFDNNLKKSQVWDNKIQYPMVVQEQVQKSLE